MFKAVSWLFVLLFILILFVSKTILKQYVQGALFKALMYGHVEIVKLLLKAGVDPSGLADPEVRS